mmetsp:Transcript_3840/g.9183  ORF Transcript_3840/g.9183 Transcript_3840/m.9183 type:complete len:207 (-) Transcript_3840:466-1086(-)
MARRKSARSRAKSPASSTARVDLMTWRPTGGALPCDGAGRDLGCSRGGSAEAARRPDDLRSGRDGLPWRTFAMVSPCCPSRLPLEGATRTEPSDCRGTVPVSTAAAAVVVAVTATAAAAAAVAAATEEEEEAAARAMLRVRGGDITLSTAPAVAAAPAAEAAAGATLEAMEEEATAAAAAAILTRRAPGVAAASSGWMALRSETPL